MSVCKECGRELCADEISLNLKLISRQAHDYYCKSCIAKYFGCNESVIDNKIRQFKENGCLLFCRDE